MGATAEFRVEQFMAVADAMAKAVNAQESFLEAAKHMVAAFKRLDGTRWQALRGMSNGRLPHGWCEVTHLEAFGEHREVIVATRTTVDSGVQMHVTYEL